MWGKIGSAILSFFLEKIWKVGQAYFAYLKAQAEEKKKREEADQLRLAAEAKYKYIMDDPGATNEQKEQAFQEFINATKP